MWRLLPLIVLISCPGESLGAGRSPEARTIEAAHKAAKGCGLRGEDVKAERAADGSLSLVVQPSAMKTGFPAFACFLKWGESRRLRIGFFSEPPPRRR